MPISARIILDGETPMAASIIVNKHLRVARVSKMCDSHKYYFEIVSPSDRWILANIYFQFGEDLNLDLLRAICVTYSDIPLIVMADANAKFPWWFSNIRDVRGETFETLIIEFGRK